LAAHQIVKTTEICGGAARVANTRITVRTLENLRRLGASDADIIDAYPTLMGFDLSIAWDYVANHREEIETDIRENEEE